MGEDWPLERDIEQARDGIDSFAGDGSTEREAFERVVAKARAAPNLLAALELVIERYGRTDDNPAIRAARAAIAKAKGEA